MSLIASIKRFLIARRTVLTLFSLLLVSIVVGTLFPQRFRTMPEEMALWETDYLFLAKLSAYLALDHVYTSLWFLVILVLFLFSLFASSWEQIRLAYHRTFCSSRKETGREYVVKSSLTAVLATVRKKGYRFVRKQGEYRRLVKYPWGYWGNSLLHLGILLVIIASLYIVLTRQKGTVNLAETEVFAPGATWGLEERGLAAGQFYLSDAVQIDSVQPQFWDNDKLRQLRARISFLLPKGQKNSHELEVNSPVHYNGVRINLSRYYGRTFLLALTDGDGREIFLRMDMIHPFKRDQASYKTFDYEEIPFIVKAKYYADSQQQNMASDNPQLVLRLVEADKVLAELSLEKDQAGQLGPYKVKLAEIRWWVGLDCTNVRGVWLVFLGFFIIILGVGLIYFTPPREVLLRVKEKHCLISWYPGRFADCYKSELQDIIESG